MSERPEAVLSGTLGAAEVVPGDDIVVHCKPLTVVISVAGDAANIAPVASALVDELIRQGDLGFAPVAEALQAFVVAHQPTGVAALLDVGPDPIAFLFDQARAAEPSDTHHGEGRAGWNTVFVAGPAITLTAGAENLESPQLPGWSRIVAGTVSGGGARTHITAVSLDQQPIPQPDAESGSAPAEVQPAAVEWNDVPPPPQHHHQQQQPPEPAPSAEASPGQTDALDTGMPDAVLDELLNTPAPPPSGEQPPPPGQQFSPFEFDDVAPADTAPPVAGPVVDAGDEFSPFDIGESPAGEESADALPQIEDLLATDGELLATPDLYLGLDSNGEEVSQPEPGLPPMPDAERLVEPEVTVDSAEPELTPEPELTIESSEPNPVAEAGEPSRDLPPMPGSDLADSAETERRPAVEAASISADSPPLPPPPAFGAAPSPGPSPPAPEPQSAATGQLEPEPWSQPGLPPPDALLEPAGDNPPAPSPTDQSSADDLPDHWTADEPALHEAPPWPSPPPTEQVMSDGPAEDEAALMEPIADAPPWPDVAPLPHFPKSHARSTNGSLPPPPGAPPADGAGFAAPPPEGPPADLPPPSAAVPPMPDADTAVRPVLGGTPPMPSADESAPVAPLPGIPPPPPGPQSAGSSDAELSAEELRHLPPPASSSPMPPPQGPPASSSPMPPMPDAQSRLADPANGSEQTGNPDDDVADKG